MPEGFAACGLAARRTMCAKPQAGGLLLPDTFAAYWGGLDVVNALRTYRGAVGEDFGDVGGEFGRVIAHADDGVGVAFEGVLDHSLEGLIAGGFADLGIRFDIAADDLLQPAEKAL